MQEEKLKPSILLRLLGLFSGHWRVALLGTFLLLTTGLLTLLPPWLVRTAVDAIHQGKPATIFGYTFLMIVGAAALKGVLYYWQRVIMEGTGQEIVHSLRTEAISALNRRSFSFFDTSEIGDLVSRVTSDTDTLASFYGMGLVNILNNVVTILGIFFVLLSWNALLSMAYLVMLPFMMHAMLSYARKARPAMASVRKGFGSLTALTQQRLSGIESVKLLGTEATEETLFARSAGKVLSQNMAASKVQAFWLPYVFFLMGIATAVTVAWGGRLIMMGVVTDGMLLGFLSYIALLLRPIRQTGMLLGMTMTSLVSAERIFEITDGAQEDLNRGVWPDTLAGDIVFNNVSFAYSEGKVVLDDVSVQIPGGRLVALVGPSGAGKSTFINLIPGFYMPSAGEVLIDGIPTTEITLGRLRDRIGFLHQTPFIFDGTVMDNLIFGKEDASNEDIEHALQRTALLDVIESLPDGLQTEIGERGVKLSGGQRQRLAVARVLITDPRILILDEPTSSLDRETEAEVNQALSQAFSGRTTIVIAHRLWTIVDADTVVFIKEGRIRASGSHDELMLSSPEYRLFVSSQWPEREAVGR